MHLSRRFTFLFRQSENVILADLQIRNAANFEQHTFHRPSRLNSENLRTWYLLAKRLGESTRRRISTCEFWQRNYASFSPLVRISINFMLIKQGSFKAAEWALTKLVLFINCYGLVPFVWSIMLFKCKLNFNRLVHQFLIILEKICFRELNNICSLHRQWEWPFYCRRSSLPALFLSCVVLQASAFCLYWQKFSSLFWAYFIFTILSRKIPNLWVGQSFLRLRIFLNWKLAE